MAAIRRLGARGVWVPWLVGVLLSVAACSPRPADKGVGAQPPSTSEPASPSPGAKQGTAGGAGKSSDVASPAADASTAAAESPWDVDLERDEERGGHTIARHVGRTDAQLQTRLQRESISAASTYVDLEHAERVVKLALAENERRVQRWINQRSPKTNLAIRYRARDDVPTGRMLRRGASASEDVDGAVVVLRWRGDSWYVLTSYPEKPR